MTLVKHKLFYIINFILVKYLNWGNVFMRRQLKNKQVKVYHFSNWNFCKCSNLIRFRFTHSERYRITILFKNFKKKLSCIFDLEVLKITYSQKNLNGYIYSKKCKNHIMNCHLKFELQNFWIKICDELKKIDNMRHYTIYLISLIHCLQLPELSALFVSFIF